MADTVQVDIIANTRMRYVVRMQGRSDGTGETNVIKVDKSGLTGPLTGVEPGKLVLEEIRWAVQGHTSVRLDFDHDTNDELYTCSNSGYDDLRPYGGMKDPASTGGTGDILLSTIGAVSGATYDITAHFRKKQ